MRKNLLASSLKAVRDAKVLNEAQPPVEVEAKPRKLAGVLDVQRGIEQLSAGAPRSIDTAQIANSVIKDRFDVTDGIEDLVNSIRASGQKLPVLLRKTRSGPLPYEVVYGRRRIEACRQLGIEVLAYISEMDDREALISQGLENAARLQRSFIEQSVYANRLLSHDFSREEIMEVLAVDKTTISRMLSVVSAVPAAVIEAIGPAHDSGRRPWQQLREAVQMRHDLDDAAILALVPQHLGSNERLQALLKALAVKAQVPGSPITGLSTVKRDLPGGIHIEREAKRLSIRCSGKELLGFAEFIDQRLDQLLQEFKESADRQSTGDQH